MKPILWGIVLIIIMVWFGAGKRMFHVSGYNASSMAQKRWWMDNVGAIEPFVGSEKPKKRGKGGSVNGGSVNGGSVNGGNDSDSESDSEDIDRERMPGKPAPVTLYDTSPYHLLNDILETSDGPLSSINSRSCYSTDAEVYLSKVGNFRQMTNNYKREYPDSCSATRQEFVLSFYTPLPFTPSRA